VFWGVLKGFSEIQLILAVLDPPKVPKSPRFIQVLGLTAYFEISICESVKQARVYRKKRRAGDGPYLAFLLVGIL
jgi:hypothetical protein